MSFLRLGASCVVVDANGDVLLSQRGDLKTWLTPGGRLDRGETLADCAIREAREETGIAAELIRPVGLYYRPGWNRLNVLFLARKTGGDLLAKTHETLDNRFFSLDDLPAQAHNIKQIKHALDGKTILHEYDFNRDEFCRLKRKFAARYFQNLLAGRPEPRYPRFNVQAVGIIEDGQGRVLASGEKYLPGVVIDGSAPPWKVLQTRIRVRFTEDITLHWRGIWHYTGRDRITFVFAGSVQNLEHPTLMHISQLRQHHRHLIDLSHNTDGVFVV